MENRIQQQLEDIMSAGGKAVIVFRALGEAYLIGPIDSLEEAARLLTEEIHPQIPSGIEYDTGVSALMSVDGLEDVLKGWGDSAKGN